MNKDTIDKLVKLIEQAYDKRGASAFKVAGSNGGDAVYYHLAIGGNAWGDGQVYISFTNHGYIDRGVNVYNYDDESPELYAPKLNCY